MIGKRTHVVLVGVLVLVIAIFAGCGAEEKKIDYTGQWKLTDGKASGIKLTAEQLVSSLGEISMQIEAKGKITKKEESDWMKMESGVLRKRGLLFPIWMAAIL